MAEEQRCMGGTALKPSQLERVWEGLNRMEEKLHHVYRRITEIRRVLVGKTPEGPGTDSPIEPGDGAFSEILNVMTRLGSTHVAISDELLQIEMSLGIDTSKKPAEQTPVKPLR